MEITPNLTRSRLAGLSLTAGAVLLAVTAAVDPAVPPGGLPELLGYAGTHPGRWTAWALCLVATALLMLPGVVSASRRVPSGRGATLTVVGMCLAGAGLVGMVAVGTSETDVVVLGRYATSPEVLAAAADLEEALGLAVAFLLMLPGFYLGVPLLFWGLRRAGVLPLWVAVCATAGSLASWFGSELGTPWEAVVRLPLVVAVAACGLAFARRDRPASPAPSRGKVRAG